MMELIVAFPGSRSIEREKDIFAIRTAQMTIVSGQDTGPTPLNLILAGLGMCSGMELLAFCKTRNLAVDDIALRISPNMNMEARRVESIQVDVVLPDDFPAQYVDACERAVSQCSVKSHLERPLPVAVSTTNV